MDDLSQLQKDIEKCVLFLYIKRIKENRTHVSGFPNNQLIGYLIIVRLVYE